MIKVEWFGGPDDGSTIEVRDDCRHINVYLLRPMRFEFYDQEKDPSPDLPEIVALPIMRRGDGRFVICYPKGRS